MVVKETSFNLHLHHILATGYFEITDIMAVSPARAQGNQRKRETTLAEEHKIINLKFNKLNFNLFFALFFRLCYKEIFLRFSFSDSAELLN